MYRKTLNYLIINILLYSVSGSESIFFRGNNPTTQHSNSIPIIKLGLNYKNSEDKYLHRQIGISFNKNNSFERENGYDSELYDEAGTDFYWKFYTSDAKLSIAGVQEISKNLEVPFEINVEEANEFTIEIDEWNLDNQKVYIRDNVTQKYYFLNKEKMTIYLEKGLYEDRFSLTFRGPYVEDLNNEILNGSLLAFFDNSSSEFVIKNETSLEINKVELYNLLGQKVKSFKDFNPDLLETRFQMNNPSLAMYIVKVYTNRGEFTKKIIIK